MKTKHLIEYQMKCDCFFYKQIFNQMLWLTVELTFDFGGFNFVKASTKKVVK